MKPNEKGNRIRPQGSSDDPKRSPRFNIYWLWAAIAVILIGFNLFSGKFTPTAEDITQQQFQEMLLKGDVENIDIISNKELVRVYINKDSLKKEVYQKKLTKKQVLLAKQQDHNSSSILATKIFSRMIYADFTRLIQRLNKLI